MNAGLPSSPVKLLFDENLSPKLVRRLADLFPGSAHVHDCRLGNSDDGDIWRFALAEGFAIVSKDLDFYDRSIMHGSPPKLLWLRTGNCSSEQVEGLLRHFFSDICRFEDDPLESLLILP